MEINLLDLSRLTYENWLRFVFDHPVHEPLWHFAAEWQYEVSSPAKTLGDIQILFNNPAPLLKRFSLAHIEQGFWFLPSSNGLMWLILVPTIPWSQRRSAIQSIANLFETFFSQVELGTSIYMWWDSLLTYCAWEDKDLISDREALHEVLQVLARLKANVSPRVKESASHGIEHLGAIAEKAGDADLKGMLRSAGLAS